MTISPASRLRTMRWVPVWQKVQESVHPTWEEMQERAAVLLRDVDGLHLTAVGEAQQPLPRSVRCALLRRHLRTRQGIALGERSAERAADRRHYAKFDGASVIDPVPELLGPHSQTVIRHADGVQALREFLAREANQAFSLVLYGARLVRCVVAGPGAPDDPPVYGHAFSMASWILVKPMRE